MTGLEERVEQLEGDLAELKADIRALLVELKVLIARDQNPLEDKSPAHSKPTHDSPVIVVAPSTGN